MIILAAGQVMTMRARGRCGGSLPEMVTNMAKLFMDSASMMGASWIYWSRAMR